MPVATRVLFVDQTASLGGAELSLLALVRGQSAAAAHRVVLFADGRLAEILRQEGFDVVVAPFSAGVSEVRKASGLATQLTTLRATQQHVRQVRRLAQGFDVVYANTAKSLVISALAFRKRRQAVIYHLRDMITADHFSKANRWALVTLANRYAARVIANSQATAKAFIAAGGKRSLTTVIPNGFDTEPFDRALAERYERDYEPAEEPARKVVAVFGRLAPWKGQDVAIRAIADLEEAELWVVGDALFGEDAYAHELRELARALGVEERVKFLGFRDDVPSLMQQADVVAHTSRVPEPFGRVVVEAMLSARPVVATRGGGIEEIIEDKQTGLLATMGDADDLARCIRTLLDEAEFARRLAKAGALVARDRYALPHCLARTNEVIDQVASSM